MNYRDKMLKILVLKILLLCLPLNIINLQAKDEKSVSSFVITDHKVLAPELGKALVDQGFIEKLYQSQDQTALTKLVKGCYHILDGKLRRTNQVHNAAHYLTPEITAKLVMVVTGNYDQETLIKEWQEASKEHKLQRSHIKDLIKLINNALSETKDSHLSHLPLAIVIGTLSLHPESVTQQNEFKNAISQLKNDYKDLSLAYDFDVLNIKQLSYPPAFNSINLGYKGKNSAPPCVEDALRNICYALLWNTETACLDLTQINQDLKLNSNFLKFISKYQDSKNLTSIECAQDWLNLVSGLANVEYFRTDYELCGHIENGLKVLNYLFGTKDQNLPQFLAQVSTNQKHSFAGNQGVGEITVKKFGYDFKILVNFAHNHAQADIQRPTNNKADIARNLILAITQNNDLSQCHQKISLMLLVSKFKDVFTLNWAIDHGKINLAKLLIAAGADVNAIGNHGRTALINAVRDGHTEIIKLLIAAGADVNARDNSGNTALSNAACSIDTEIIKLLLAAGVDVNARDYLGRTVLISVAIINTEIIKLLLAAGLDVNARDNSGNTALLNAAWSSNSTEIIKLLLAAGVDVNARDYLGRTALIIAERYGGIEIAKLLRTHGAR